MTSRVLLACLLVVLLLSNSIDAWCVSGVVNSDVCNKDSTQRCQSQVKHVLFDEPFIRTPNVMVAISKFDIWNGENSRVDAYASDLTPLGFNVNMKSWSSTHMYSITVSWMACL